MRERTVYSQQYYQKNREKILTQQREYQKLNREKIRVMENQSHKRRRMLAMKAIVAGGLDNIHGNELLICANCGCNHVEYLEINHINGGGSKEHNRLTINMYQRILNKTRRVDDLNLLCAPCNALDHLKKKYPSAQYYPVVRWE